MEPFSITCTTCKSRLKVKSHGVIGQMLACPKCGGMVLVKLPTAASPSDAARLNAQTAAALPTARASADSQETFTEGRDFDDVEALLSVASPKSPPPAAPAPTKEKATNGSVAHAAASPLASAAVAQPAAESDKPSIPGSEATSPEPLPGGEWSQKRPWKYWLFLAASVLAGIGLALAVVAFSLTFFDDETQAGVDPQNLPPTSAESDPGKSVTQSPEAVPTPAENPVPIKPSPSDPPDKVKNPDPPVTPEKPVPEPVSPDEDPIGIVNPAPTDPQKTPDPMTGGPDPLTKFDHLLEGADDPTRVVDAPSATPSDPTKTPDLPEGTPSKPALPRPAARTLNLLARLADPLQGITVEGVPLADFLQEMQNLSGVPITLEPDVLPLFKMSPESLINLKAEKTKFGLALAEALKGTSLEIVTSDSGLIVRVRELVKSTAMDEPKMLLVNHAVHDLVSDEARAGELAERLMALIEPGLWGDDEDEAVPSLTPGKEAFAIRQKKSVHAQVLVFLERLRVARGIKPLNAAKGYDPAVFQLASRTERAASSLATPVTLNFSRSTPLEKILQRLAKTAKVRILVDWQGIAAAGWNPDAEATLTADKLPLSAALTALLDPMDLAFRVVDAGTLQVVTRETLASRLEIEFYPAADLVAGPEEGEAFLARIRSALAGEDATGAVGEAGENVSKQGELWLDPVSKAVVASLPQPKQQRLAQLLAQWREAK